MESVYHSSRSWTRLLIIKMVLRLLCSAPRQTRLWRDRGHPSLTVSFDIFVTMPSIEDRDHPEIGACVKKYMVGKAGVDGNKRMRLIENLILGAGVVSYLAESIHGAGSPQARKIMITHLAGLASVKRCALNLCGL